MGNKEEEKKRPECVQPAGPEACCSRPSDTDAGGDPKAAGSPTAAGDPSAAASEVRGTHDAASRVTELESRVAELEAALAASVEQVSALTAERDTWQSKATGIYDQYLRAKSDFDGFRKRTERDFEDRLSRAKADYLASMLDVLDNFDRFLSAAEKSGQAGGERSFDAFFKGVSMVYKQLLDVLAKEGVEVIENPVGKQMDPALHEAVAAEDGGEHGTVLEEIQKGYMFKGLVLRATKVKVAR
ncbi:MAG: nucleotide exchange factor GrpE [Bacillota bacterium]